MKPPITTYRARARADGREILVEISAPAAAADSPEYWCEVRLPGIFPDLKRIAGVDAAQAVELAGGFAASMLEHHGYDWVGGGPPPLAPPKQEP